MASLVGSRIGFRLVGQAEFDRLVVTRTLVRGTIYFLENKICLALTTSTYNTYGGASVEEIVQQIIENNLIVEQIANVTEQIIQNISEQITNEFVEQIVKKITEQSIENITQYVIDNAYTEIYNQIYQQIVENVSEYIENITNQVIENVTNQINTVAETIVNEHTEQFLQTVKQIVDDAIEEINTTVKNILDNIETIIGNITLRAPDGSIIAINNDGNITVQLATNNQFGIVRGQPNNTLDTWHQVAANDGLLSVNREVLEFIIDKKIEEAECNHQCEPGGEGNCHCPPPPPLTWQTMNGTLQSEVKQDVHMFASIAFPKKMPNRIELFDRLTFIPIDAPEKCNQPNCIYQIEL